MNEEQFAVVIPLEHKNEFLTFNCEEVADKYLAENIHLGAYKIRYFLTEKDSEDA